MQKTKKLILPAIILTFAVVLFNIIDDILYIQYVDYSIEHHIFYMEFDVVEFLFRDFMLFVPLVVISLIFLFLEKKNKDGSLWLKIFFGLQAATIIYSNVSQLLKDDINMSIFEIIISICFVALFVFSLFRFKYKGMKIANYFIIGIFALYNYYIVAPNFCDYYRESNAFVAFIISNDILNCISYAWIIFIILVCTLNDFTKPSKINSLEELHEEKTNETSKDALDQKLATLNNLFMQGLIDENEYKDKRQKIINNY